MKINIPREVTREVIENIIVTALEGGSNYWYYINDNGYDAVRNVIEMERSLPFPLALVEAVLDHGAVVEICDIEDTDEVLGVVSAESIRSGLEKLADSELSHVLMDELSCNGDADTADICFQFIVMGEIVFG